MISHGYLVALTWTSTCKNVEMFSISSKSQKFCIFVPKFIFLFPQNSFELTSLSSAFYGLINQFDQTISNVLYTNGLFDPFRYFGRLFDESQAGTVINIECKCESI